MDQSEENWTVWLADEKVECIEMSRQHGKFSRKNGLKRWRWGNVTQLSGKAQSLNNLDERVIC